MTARNRVIKIESKSQVFQATKKELARGYPSEFVILGDNFNVIGCGYTEESAWQNALDGLEKKLAFKNYRKESRNHD